MATLVAFVVIALLAAVDRLSDLRQGTIFRYVFGESEWSARPARVGT
jgi:hypothetical protein